jgi:hypothetical protein
MRIWSSSVEVRLVGSSQQFRQILQLRTTSMSPLDEVRPISAKDVMCRAAGTCRGWVASCRYVQYMPRLLLPYLPNLRHTLSALVNIQNCSHSLRAAILGA